MIRQLFATIKLHEVIYIASLMLIAIGMPLWPLLMSIGQIALILNWIIEGNFKEKLNKIKRNSILLLIPGIYLMHIIGLAWTTNFSYALNDLQIKLPLLLLPIFMISSINIQLIQLKNILLVFILSVTVSSFYSFYLYQTLDINFYFNLREISPIISHIRLSLMCCLAAFACFFLINRDKLFSNRNIGLVILSIWLLVFIGILGARITYVAIPIILTIFLIHYLVKQKKLIISALFGLIMLIAPVSFYHFIPSVNFRVNEVVDELNRYKAGANPNGQSILQRFEYWKVGAGLVKENYVYGVGTGDVDDAYQQYYETKGTLLIPKFRHRAHNQYLTILITFGIFGGIYFLVAYLLPAIRSDKLSAFMFVVYFIISSISMLTEDTLETQAGATFFAFYYLLFLKFKED